MKTKITNEFVPIWKFCKENDISKQKIYRWIREGKIKSENIKREVISVERLFINQNALK